MKFVIVGEASTGKTSILTQLTEQRFLKTSEPTIGVEFGSKLIRIAPEDDTQAQAVVKTQIWDVAGTPSFRSITAGYCTLSSLLPVQGFFCQTDLTHITLKTRSVLSH